MTLFAPVGGCIVIVSDVLLSCCLPDNIMYLSVVLTLSLNENFFVGSVFVLEYSIPVISTELLYSYVFILLVIIFSTVVSVADIVFSNVIGTVVPSLLFNNGLPSFAFTIVV